MSPSATSQRYVLVAILVPLALTDCEDLALLGLLLRGVGEDDAARGGLVLFDRLNNEAITQRLEIHAFYLLESSWVSVLAL